MENKVELINDLSDIDLILLVFVDQLYTNTLESLRKEYDYILSTLRRLLHKDKQNRYKTPRDIINLMINKYKLPSDFATTKIKKREYSEPRQKAMVLSSHIFPSLSLAEIGAYFGKRDHATVLHAKKTVKSLWQSNKEFRESFNQMQIYFLGNIEITFDD